MDLCSYPTLKGMYSFGSMVNLFSLSCRNSIVRWIIHVKAKLRPDISFYSHYVIGLSNSWPFGRISKCLPKALWKWCIMGIFQYNGGESGYTLKVIDNAPCMTFYICQIISFGMFTVLVLIGEPNVNFVCLSDI